MILEGLRTRVQGPQARISRRRRPAPGLMHHSDQGNQYRASLYQTILARRGVVVSMSRRGNCYDNAPAESFFSSLKNELVRHRQFQTQAEPRWRSKTISPGSTINSAYIRRWAIAVPRSSSGRKVTPNSRVCYSGATSGMTIDLLEPVASRRDEWFGSLSLHNPHSTPSVTNL